MSDQTTDDKDLEDIAKSITKRPHGEDYTLKCVWMGFLIAYPSFFTFLTFVVLALVGYGCMSLDTLLLLALIGKTTVSDIAIVSYVMITKSLFPFTKEEAI